MLCVRCATKRVVFMNPSAALTLSHTFWKHWLVYSIADCCVMQAVTMLVKFVIYNGGSLFVSMVFLRVLDSVAFWHVLASLPESVGLNLVIAKIVMGVWACIGLLCLLEDRFEVGFQCL